MPASKTQTLSFRVQPAIKAGLRVAEKEHRSQADMIELMIREHCSRMGISLEADTITDKYLVNTGS